MRELALGRFGGCLLVALVAVAAAPGTSLVDAQRPDVQVAFCHAIEQADEAYEPANKAWYAETNPIVQDRLTKKLAQMRDDRDLSVLRILGATKPALSGWIVRLSDFSTGYGTPKDVNLELSARCNVMVTLKTQFVPTDQVLDILAGLTRGAYLRISGTFVSHDAERNPAARALDWDAFEHSAMQSPTYRFVITTISAE